MKNTQSPLPQLFAALALVTLTATAPAQTPQTEARDARAAEQLAARQAAEPLFGVFVYERLGATPSLRMRERSTGVGAVTTGAEPNAFGTFTYDALQATPRLSLPRKAAHDAAKDAPLAQ